MTAETVRHDVLEALRHYVHSYQESVLQFSGWMGLPLTDGNALGEIMWAEAAGAPLSPTGLAARTGITTGAVNALINRLEQKGLVARSREQRDRRAVTLRATPAAHLRSRPHLATATARLDEALDAYDVDQLALVRDVLRRFADVLPHAEGEAHRGSS